MINNFDYRYHKKPQLIEHYMGYDIYYSGVGGMWSDYYTIYQHGERATQGAYYSQLACKNVINSYLKSIER